MDESADFVLGGIVGLFAWFFGGLDGYLNVLITLVVVNFILSCLDKVINRKFNFQDFIFRIGDRIKVLERWKEQNIPVSFAKCSRGIR